MEATGSRPREADQRQTRKGGLQWMVKTYVNGAVLWRIGPCTKGEARGWQKLCVKSAVYNQSCTHSEVFNTDDRSIEVFWNLFCSMHFRQVVNQRANNSWTKSLSHNEVNVSIRSQIAWRLPPRVWQMADLVGVQTRLTALNMNGAS